MMTKYTQQTTKLCNTVFFHNFARQILIDFQNSVTGTLYGKSAEK